MLYLILNLAITLLFIFETYLLGKKESVYEGGTNPITSNILLMSIVTAVYTLLYVSQPFMTEFLFSSMMKLCFVMEGFALINIATCFPYYAWKYTNRLSETVKYLLYLVVFILVMFKFSSVKMDYESGIQIETSYVFTGEARNYFPWTWVTLYNLVFRFFIPGFTCVVMLLRNEQKGSKLDCFRGYIYALALSSLWIFSALLENTIVSIPSASFLHFIIYVPILILIPLGSNINSAPSGRNTFSFIVKSLSLYVVPAIAMGCVFMLLYPLNAHFKVIFIIFSFLWATFILWVIRSFNNFISRTSLGHSADYALTFEKDLASLDYSGEMDDIAAEMFRIFKTNAESSSMSVYINGGNDTFEVAYSSSGKTKKIENVRNLFGSLLNMDRNVVGLYEVDNDNTLYSVKKELNDFFISTDSDALFILNEGRDVHGFILLGIKDSKEHYKEYDLNVFKKLYSYFFVFGYYMRNISNKEIIGTVNRELRMSSQIITSIQENIDILNNPKMDAGCIMVPAHNIGGEFVDMIRLTDSRHMFVVGDLSGKGIAASMSMVILKQIIRAYLAETHDFKQLVVKINRFIRDNLQKGTIFAGMFAIVNFDNDTMYYINCGIPAIFLYTEAYNNVIEIQGGGHILGFVKDISPYISVKQVKLNKNDIILTCTDGLIESHSLRGEKFGKDRVQRFMVSNSMYPASRMAQFEHDELMKFMSHEMEDDVSVLVLKYLKSNESERAEAEAMKAEFYESMMNSSKDDLVKKMGKLEEFVQELKVPEGNEEKEESKD